MGAYFVNGAYPLSLRGERCEGGAAAGVREYIVSFGFDPLILTFSRREKGLKIIFLTNCNGYISRNTNKSNFEIG